jgi:tetratricopeptide (TPR) repeat protein
MEGAAPVNWLPAAVVLALGLVAGFVFALRARAARTAAAPGSAAVPLELRDLMGKRDVLLHQLQELEDMAGKKTAGELSEERYALELQAAAVLMELDDKAAARDAQAEGRGRKKKGAAAEAAAEAAPGFLASRPALRGFLWGAGAMAVLGGLLVSVRGTATQRQEGGSLTGNTPMDARPPMAAPPAEAQSDEEAQIRAAIEQNPDDLDARMALVQVDLGRQDMMGVWNETKAILERSPGHPRALAYQALVRLAMGQGDVARGMLEKLVAAHPDVLEGYLHLALVHMRSGREKEADAVMERAAKQFPARAEMLRSLMAEMKRQAEAEGPAPEAGPADPHAGLGSAEPREAETAPPPPAAGGTGVAGIVDLDPSLKGSVAPGALVFVTARAAGQSSGPPAAVKRLPAAFPLRFQLSNSDAMLGGELPDRLRIEARVDSDGDPLTRDASDPSARIDPVSLGTRDLRLVLRR